MIKDAFRQLLELRHPPHHRATELLELASLADQAIEYHWAEFDMIFFETLANDRLCRVSMNKAGIFDHFRWLTLTWDGTTPSLTLVQRNIWRDREHTFHRRSPYLFTDLTPVERVRVQDLLRLGFDQENQAEMHPSSFDTIVFGSAELLTITSEELLPARAAS